jgi:hypothetical protein
MKTKSLILTAILSLAGAAGVMAQSNVYSQNIVGYVSQAYKTGYQLGTVPFNGSPNNQVANLFANTPSGLTIFKFKRATGGYTLNGFDSDVGWDDPTMVLNPGDGFWVYSPVAYTNTYVGEVALNSTNAIKTGYSIIGSAVPKTGLISTDLGFPAVEGDTVFQQKPAGGYNVFSFSDGVWDTEPTIKVNEGFWIYSFTTHSDWNISLTVGP